LYQDKDKINPADYVLLSTKPLHNSTCRFHCVGVWLCFTASSFAFLTPNTLLRRAAFRQKSISLKAHSLRKKLPAALPAGSHCDGTLYR